MIVVVYLATFTISNIRETSTINATCHIITIFDDRKHISLFVNTLLAHLSRWICRHIKNERTASGVLTVYLEEGWMWWLSEVGWGGRSYK